MSGVGVCLDSIASERSTSSWWLENRGTIVSSPDGLSWIKEPSGTSDALFERDLWEMGVLVAVGENGQILTSADGPIVDQPRRTGITDHPFSV